MIATRCCTPLPCRGTESKIQDAFFAIVVITIIMSKHCLRKPGHMSQFVVVMAAHNSSISVEVLIEQNNTHLRFCSRHTIAVLMELNVASPYLFFMLRTTMNMLIKENLTNQNQVITCPCLTASTTAPLPHKLRTSS